MVICTMLMVAGGLFGMAIFQSGRSRQGSARFRYAARGCATVAARWARRDLRVKRYLYIWADGMHFQPRLEDDKQCILVIIGADAQDSPVNAA